MFYSHSPLLAVLDRGTDTLRLKMGVRTPDLAPDKLLDLDVVPRGEVDHVLLVNAHCARAHEYVCTYFSGY